MLNGNREEEDILCREEIDGLVEGKEERCKLVYALTKPTEGWNGVRGRVGKELLEKEVGNCGGQGEDLVLVCGPEMFEKSVKGILMELGWGEEDMLFF